MSKIYEKTALTPLQVARFGGYIDWAIQPSKFKKYPDFLYRYPLIGHEALKVIKLSRQITLKTQIEGNAYYQLNTPSAGNLHPLELYVQIRGIKGLISGIYHVYPLEESLVLIREIADDGLEVSVGLSEKFYGILFLLSIVPFRSEWKYGERGFRYCYLDAGHQIGAIQASATVCEQKVTILSNFDSNCLNNLMGFFNQEFICGVLAIGSQTKKAVKAIKAPLMKVSPTDYCDSHGAIINDILEQNVYSRLSDENNFYVDEKAIFQRRSARKFSQNKISKSQFEHFMHLSTNMTNSQSCHVVVLQDDYLEAGIYKNNQIIQRGQFSKEMIALLVNQNFINNAFMIVIITSEKFNANELMNSAVNAHALHLEVQMHNAGFSGIGAFYDKKLQKFLQTKEYILYVCAIG